MKIAIVGAGISGLAAGRFLDALGHEVVLFESAASLNTGLMETRNVEGYAFDVGGGHIIYTADPWVSTFIDQLYDDAALEKLRRRTRIIYQGRFIKYPFENGLSDLPPEANFECLLGFIRAYMARSRVTEPDNFRDWIHYRMGAGIAKHFMVPYNEKIWDSDLSEMGVEWVSGRVPEAPLEDIVRSSMGISTEGYTHQTQFAYPREGGINDLAKRVGMPVQKHIHFGHRVQHIRRKGDHLFEVDGLEVDEVIFTAPLDRAPGIVEGMDRQASEAAEALEHISLTSFLFDLDERDAKPYSWIYLPAPEQGPANRLTYLSNYSPLNAPQGKASILTEVTHRGPLDVSPAYRANLRGHLVDLGFLREGRQGVEAHGTVEYAYIFFDRAFTRKRSLALEGLGKLGVHPLGRFGQYNYFNMDHCIREAKMLADRLQAGQDV